MFNWRVVQISPTIWRVCKLTILEGFVYADRYGDAVWNKSEHINAFCNLGSSIEAAKLASFLNENKL